MTARIAFHIGYHKTASTWFQREAAPRHPGVRMLFTGEPWRDPLLRELVLTPRRSFDAAATRRLFDERMDEIRAPDTGIVIGSEERLSGHAASGGFDTFEIAERIAAVIPEAMIFAVVREQVDMIESEYLQLLQEGSSAGLDAYLEFQPTLSNAPGFDLGQYEYDRLADHYVRLFGPTRHRLFEFRAFCADPRGFLDELAGYLEIEPWPQLSGDILHRKVNPTLPRRLLGVRRFLNHFERRPLNPYPVVSIRPFWRGPLWWAASRLPPRRRSLLQTDTRTALHARYHDSNERLAEHHGIRFDSRG